MEDALAAVGVARDELASERREEHVLLRRVHQLEQLGRLDHQDREAEVEAEAGRELEQVDAVAVVVHDLEQADDLRSPERGGSGSTCAAGRAVPARRSSGRWISVIAAWISSTSARNAGSRYSRGCGSGLAITSLHASRIRAHDHDAVGEEDRLLDEMRDEQQALQPHAAARPEAVDLRAQRLRRQHVERGERLVHAQQLGPADQRPGDADALLHAAGELLRVRLLEALEADEIDGVLDAVAPPRAGARPPCGRGRRATLSATVSHG